jgi:hypothetical protein
MVTIDRKVFGLRYQTVFFPTMSALAGTLDAFAPTRVARFFWTDAQLDDARFLVRHEASATICIDLDRPLDAILKDMSQTTRRKLRQAEKLSERIAIARNGPEVSRAFLALYNGFARSKRSGVSPITADILQRYAGNSDIFLVYLDGSPLCGHVNLRDSEGQRDRLLFSANRRFDDAETARLCAILNSHLHWHEICAYREEGLKTYDLGGFSNGENAGIDRFKASLGGTVVNEHTYLCAGSPRLARMCIRLHSLLKRSRPFSGVNSKAQESDLAQCG